MANRDFVKLVLKAHKKSALPQLPLEQLGLTNFIVADDTWTKELYWDNHVLPVCKDLKFRVQHNALGFLYKFHWRTNVASPDQCIHNCSAKENAVHLFWECRVAQFQWDFFLRPFNVLFTQPAVWQMLLFPDTTKILPTAIRLYGEPAVFITFSIIRCCVLRALWLHQNKWLYNLNVSTSSPFVQHHAKAYARLHLSLFKAKAFTKNNKKWIQMAEYLENQLCLVTTITSVDTTTTTSATTALSPTLSTGILPDPVDPRSPLSAFALESSLQSSSSAGPPSLSIANLGVLERSDS
ncbi:unnamed protein product [Phytophthora lilii]|uniref:Unnamed protein product n=1 Tax=Phytophthora lilii TaxID=2077276 RepID=A0A9W6XIM2_9STRA|nr:unnamed protein product [Phytophthora lilii]